MQVGYEEAERKGDCQGQRCPDMTWKGFCCGVATYGACMYWVVCRMVLTQHFHNIFCQKMILVPVSLTLIVHSICTASTFSSTRINQTFVYCDFEMTGHCRCRLLEESIDMWRGNVPLGCSRLEVSSKQGDA
jgi:hypothetical protein